MKSCGQGENVGALEATLTAIPTQRPGTTPRAYRIHNSQQVDDRVGLAIRFRRAAGVAYGMWAAFAVIDWAVVRYLQAGDLEYFLALRAAVFILGVPVLVRLHRSPVPSTRMLALIDIVVYTAPAVAIALMCVEFRGVASPYAAGVCVVLLARAVTAHDRWKVGLMKTGVPVAAFFCTLIGSSLFSARMAAQLRDPAAIATFLLGAAYILATYVFLVVGGHIIWSLRRQVFEARNLGRYRLKRRIASGGMGDVWLAYHPGLKRDVAVKILRPEQQERSDSALWRFEREAHATAELVHPNTVRVFDYGATEDGLWYYVMELLHGETLAEHVIRTGPLTPARAVHIVGQAARALGEAHERGIVHRDVKPENVFLTSLGGEHDFVKVLDFGIAKVQSAETTMTDTGCVLGTPAYISPEVAVGREADPRSDVYGLGAVLYFLLCGRPPFEAETSGALIFAHVHERVASPSRLLGRPIPADLEAVVLRALEKDPDARYPTASELALALASCALAGTWTIGDALIARKSSRPPPASGLMEAMPGLAPPAVPRDWAEGDSSVDEMPLGRNVAR